MFWFPKVTLIANTNFAHKNKIKRGIQNSEKLMKNETDIGYNENVIKENIQPELKN